MAQFEADKMVHLLQFCCWKARCTMDHSGFQDLAHKIDNISEPTQLTPNDRYFIDLLSDSTNAMKKDNLIGRRQAYIDLLLRFAGFDTWKDWEHSLYNASEYVDAETLDLTAFQAMELVVCFPATLEKQLLPSLSFTQRSAGYPLQALPCNEDQITGNMQFVVAKLETFPFVIWAIPVSWKDQLPVLKDPSWDQLIESRRIVPVWMEDQDLWDNKHTFIPWLKHHQTIGGLSGILTVLLYLQEVVKKYNRPDTAKEKTAQWAGKTQNLQHNKGTFFLGDVQIKGEHLAMGDIHQTIHNHKNNEK